MSLNEHLIPNEKIMGQFTPVRYQETEYDCAVTNSRVLLYARDRARLIEIEHHYISAVILAKEKNDAAIWVAIILFILGALFLILGILSSPVFGLGWPYDETVLVSLLLLGSLLPIGTGISFLLLYFTQMKYAALIQEGVNNYKLYATQDLTKELVKAIRNIKYGSTEILDRASLGGISSPSVQDEKYCIYCGFRLRAIATFCDKCGKKQE